MTPTMSAPALLYQNAFLTITRPAGQSWLRVDWHGEQTDASVMEGCETILAILQEHKLSKILNDTTHAQGCWTETVGWLVYDWLPRMQVAGMRHCAHVFGTSRGVRLSAGMSLLMFDPAKAGFQPFRDPQEAEKWLAGMVPDRQSSASAA